MKPFDLEAAKRGAAVCTRGGRAARIICFDLKSDHSVIARVPSAPDEEDIVEYWPDGRWYPACAESRLDLMMRDDDYAEKLARGEYGNHIEDKLEKVDPVIKENLTVGREYWRRVYAGQMMAAAFPVLVSTDWQAKGEYANIPAETLIARQAIDFADALLEELEKTEKKL